jgi:hypothetical protein
LSWPDPAGGLAPSGAGASSTTALLIRSRFQSPRLARHVGINHLARSGGDPKAPVELGRFPGGDKGGIWRHRHRGICLRRLRQADPQRRCPGRRKQAPGARMGGGTHAASRMPGQVAARATGVVRTRRSRSAAPLWRSLRYRPSPRRHLLAAGSEPPTRTRLGTISRTTVVGTPCCTPLLVEHSIKASLSRTLTRGISGRRQAPVSDPRASPSLFRCDRGGSGRSDRAMTHATARYRRYRPAPISI